MTQKTEYSIDGNIITIRISKQYDSLLKTEQISFRTDNEDLKLCVISLLEANVGIGLATSLLKEPIERQDWEEVESIIKDLKCLSLLKNNFEIAILEDLKKIGYD